LEVGVDVGREVGLGLHRLGAELFEAADCLGLAVFTYGEVGLGETVDGVAFGVGDVDVYDGFAGVDLQGGSGRGLWGLRVNPRLRSEIWGTHEDEEK
jgi:hypothetical protein